MLMFFLSAAKSVYRFISPVNVTWEQIKSIVDNTCHWKMYAGKDFCCCQLTAGVQIVTEWTASVQETE